MKKKEWLIGPQLYPLYILVLKIVVIVAIAGTIIGNTVDFIFNNKDILSYFGNSLALGINAMISGFGWVTLVFAIMERTTKEEALEKLKAEMEKDKKIEIKASKTERISRIGVLVGMVFILALLVFLNYYPEFIGVYMNIGKNAEFVPLLDLEAFGAYLPYISSLLVLQLFFSIVKLAFKKWNYLLALINLVVNGLSLTLALMLLSDSNIIASSFIARLPELSPVPLFKMLKIVFIIVFIFDSLEGFYHAFKNSKFHA